jgi:acyl-coenzyme A thioesterase PaaI-like protein
VSLESESNGCFVCGPANPIGLNLRFRLDGEICRSQFTADSRHIGYRDVVHGGIVFSLLDDVMANWLWLQGIQCFTAKADVRYRAQLPVGVPVQLEGRCLKRKGRLALMEGKVLREDTQEVVAEANGSFMTPQTPQ